MSNKAIQNLTGVTIGLTTALASFQRTGCSGNCRSCQSCTAAGLVLIASPFLVKHRGHVQQIILGITIVGLIIFIISMYNY
ncbi:hypothetical protein ACHOLT_20060 [Desulfitobacterium sp. Sab5]|uniref:hypothetical protein n=1 Tax=Desulfitobacterium nosdiversum TaxID=3375356 RepID=UPI003CF47581